MCNFIVCFHIFIHGLYIFNILQGKVIRVPWPSSASLPHSFCPQKPNPREKRSPLKNLDFQGCVWDTVPQTLANFPRHVSLSVLDSSDVSF